MSTPETFRLQFPKETNQRVRQEILRVYRKNNLLSSKSVQGDPMQATRLLERLIQFANKVSSDTTGLVIKDRWGPISRPAQNVHIQNSRHTMAWSKGSGKSALFQSVLKETEMLSKKMVTPNKAIITKEI